MNELKVSGSSSDTDNEEVERIQTEEQFDKMKYKPRAVQNVVTPPSDRSVFKYYFAAVRPANIVLLIFVAASIEVAAVIRCKWFHLNLCGRFHTEDRLRCLAHLVGRWPGRVE